MGRKAGLSDAKLRAVSDFESSPEYSEVEKLILRYAAGMTVTPLSVPDSLFAALRSHFSDPQIVELTAAIAWENYRGRFNHALEIEAEGFYCPLPEVP